MRKSLLPTPKKANKKNLEQELNYKITLNNSLFDEEFGITDELREIITEFHDELLANKKGLIKKLLEYAKLYPNVPVFKNYLSVAYANNNNPKKAWEITQQVLKEHPNYLFGKINLANLLIEEKKYEKVPEIFREDFDLKKIYPERDVFHENEFLTLNYLAIEYFLHINNDEEAEKRFEMMCIVNDEAGITKAASDLIIRHNLEKGMERLIAKRESLRYVESKEYDKSVQTTDEIKFYHPQIKELYKNDLEINFEIINEILALPRETLVKDLENVLLDSVHRYEYYYKISEDYGWDEEEFSFPLHALLLLSELKSEESINVLLYCLKQGRKYLDFWFSDLLTEYWYEPLYNIANNNINLLHEFLFEPNLFTYSRSLSSQVVSQIALNQPQRKAEVVVWFKNVIQFFLDNINNKDIFDSELVAYVINDIADINATELIDDVKKMYDTGLVAEWICGRQDEIINDIISEPQGYGKKELLNIYERYVFLNNHFDEEDDDNYNDDDDWYDDEVEESIEDYSDFLEWQKGNKP